MDAKTCYRCGSSNLQPGAIQSSGKLHFRPANAKFWTFVTADVGVDANMCMDCGAIELVGDVKKAETVMGQAKPH